MPDPSLDSTAEPDFPEAVHWPALTRRSVLAGAALLAAGCKNTATGGLKTTAVPPLRSVSRVPIGCCLRTDQLSDPAFVRLFTRNFAQITPEYEMKMSMLDAKGNIRFDAGDALVRFARMHKMAVHGHSLAWFKYDMPYFRGLAGDRDAFLQAYRKYITDVVQRWKGNIRGWDVVNEPVDNKDNSKLNESTWASVLGQDEYMAEAFAAASQADPGAVLFINEYNLERMPAKRKTYMTLIERLLKQGVKIGGIGTQSHINNDLPRGQFTAAIADLASFGLPLHISELDISFRRPGGLAANLEAQAATAQEVVEAFMALPEKQRYAITFWGARDMDSWLMKPPFNDPPGNQPLPFGNDGAPKPMTRLMAQLLHQRRKP